MKITTVIATVIVFSTMSCNAQSSESADLGLPSKLSEIGANIAPVSPAPLPETLSFAGERVPLENFDTRESLQEEIAVSMYMHSRSLKTLRSMKRYFSIIEPILKKNNIPEDFKYLVMTESNLNQEALSTAKAAGLWQLMPSVGKENDLIVNGNIDERYHIEKATEVACGYLNTAYKRFGSWTTAAASYNMGMAGTARRIESQGVKKFYDLFAPKETMRYVFRVLSYKLIATNPAAYGFLITSNDDYPVYEWKNTTVKDTNINWSEIALKNGTNYKIIRELNPWIRDYTYENKTGREFTVKIPKEGFRTKK